MGDRGVVASQTLLSSRSAASVNAAFWRLDPPISNSADVAARGMHAPVRPHWPNLQRSQYNISNSAWKGTNWSDEVMGRVEGSNAPSANRPFLQRAPKGNPDGFFCTDGRTKEDEMAGTGSL